MYFEDNYPMNCDCDEEEENDNHAQRLEDEAMDNQN